MTVSDTSTLRRHAEALLARAVTEKVLRKRSKPVRYESTASPLVFDQGRSRCKPAKSLAIRIRTRRGRLLSSPAFLPKRPSLDAGVAVAGPCVAARGSGPSVRFIALHHPFQQLDLAGVIEIVRDDPGHERQDGLGATDLPA
jgi:hypothetical protein